MHDQRTTHCHDTRHGSPRLDRKLTIVGLLFLLVLGISYIPALVPLNQSLTDYLSLVGWAIGIGLLAGGIIDYFVPDGLIVRYLGAQQKRSLLNAALAGFAMAACSHGILAIAMQLYKKGAGVPAVITFLLASPWANLPMTILLFAFFGIKALYIVLGAIVIALTTGLAYTWLDKAGLIESNKFEPADDKVEWDNVSNFSLRSAATGVYAGTVSLANMVLWWILIGILAASIIGAYVPEHFFHEYLGPDLAGLVVTLLFATVIEVCSEGTSPIAFEIFNNTGALGNPFVFLLAGVATDYTEIGLLWTNIGKRTALFLPIITVPQILIYAVWLNTYVVI